MTKAFAFLALAAATTALASPVSRQSCASGVHIIVARASTERAGQGIIGAVASDIVARIPGSDSVAVDYPATLSNYLSSEAQGVAAMTELVQDYVQSCPDAKIVLMGYSQGAHVTGDVLCGSRRSEPLGSEYSDNIAAVIQMGDPSHVVGLPFDVGTSTRNGVFPRTDTDACLAYADKWQAYCDSGDTYCDSGSSTAVHLGYVREYGDAAVDFVVSTVQ